MIPPGAYAVIFINGHSFVNLGRQSEVRSIPLDNMSTIYQTLENDLTVRRLCTRDFEGLDIWVHETLELAPETKIHISISNGIISAETNPVIGNRKLRRYIGDYAYVLLGELEEPVFELEDGEPTMFYIRKPGKTIHYCCADNTDHASAWTRKTIERRMVGKFDLEVIDGLFVQTMTIPDDDVDAHEALRIPCKYSTC